MGGREACHHGVLKWPQVGWLPGHGHGGRPLTPTGHTSGRVPWPAGLWGGCSGERSMCPSHLFLGPEPGAVGLCVSVSESEHRDACVGYGSLQNVPTLGTPSSPNLTALEQGWGRSAAGSLQWLGRNHGRESLKAPLCPDLSRAWERQGPGTESRAHPGEWRTLGIQLTGRASERLGRGAWPTV